MCVLLVGPPLYGLSYPVLSLAQVFRVNDHEVLIVGRGQFAQKAAKAGLAVFDAAPGLDSEASYHHHEAQRKKSNIETQVDNLSFFNGEMADHLVEFTGRWRPDLIIYSPLGVIGPLIAVEYGIPIVIQTVGFDHTPWHIKGVTRSLTDTYRRHSMRATPHDMVQTDVTSPSMSILENDGEPIIPMQYIPYNGGAVRGPWQEGRPERKRLLVNLGTVKPMVDDPDLIAWAMDSVSEVDIEITPHTPASTWSDSCPLPSSVCLVDWIPIGAFLNDAGGFIHHGGAGNIPTALHAGIPQVVFGQEADRLVNARVVAEHGCGIIPGDVGLSSNMINAFLNSRPLRKASEEVAAGMAAQPHPDEVVKSPVTMVQRE